jgi:pimeloyl-ACP methyl ester carboxylesterase
MGFIFRFFYPRGENVPFAATFQLRIDKVGSLNVQRWTEMPRGGHFAAMEEPGLLAQAIRAWFQNFRSRRDT